MLNYFLTNVVSSLSRSKLSLLIEDVSLLLVVPQTPQFFRDIFCVMFKFISIRIAVVSTVRFPKVSSLI